MSQSRPPRKRGPKGAAVDARENLLAAARQEFAARGYQATSVRAVAARAAVDPALVSHYFGNKEGLFRATVAATPDPVAVVSTAIDGPPDELGERLVRAFLTAYDEPAFRDGMLGLLRTAMTEPATAGWLREMLVERVVPLVAQRVPGPDRERRVMLAMSQLVGVALGRHVLALPPLADASIADLTEQLAPVVQGYLDAPETAGTSQL